MKKKIAFISQPEYFRFIYEHDLDNEYEVREFPQNLSSDPEVVKELVAYGADYYFFFRGEFFPEEVLSRLSGVRIALSSEPFPRVINSKWEYTIDSLNRYSVFRKIREKSFDYVFHYDAASLPLFKKDGLTISGEFAFPVACETYRRAHTDGKKSWDLFFIGRSTVHRERYFGRLKNRFNFLHIAHGVWGEPLLGYLNQSKICLNIHAENERSWEPRMQMLLATGAFIISEPITPNPYLIPGRDFVECSHPQELYSQVEYYLTHEEERKKIADQGMRTVRELLAAKNIFPSLIEGIDSGKYQRFVLGKKDFLIESILLVAGLTQKGRNFSLKNTQENLRRRLKNSIREYKRNGFFGVLLRLYRMTLKPLVQKIRQKVRVIKRVPQSIRFSVKESKRTGWNGFWRRVSWLIFEGLNSFPVPYDEYEWSRMKQRLAEKDARRQEILRDFQGRLDPAAKKKILYVIPGTAISGGIAIVLNHVNRLRERGYDTLLVSLNTPDTITWFPNVVPIISVADLNWRHLAEAEVVIATHWSTAFFVDLLPVKRKGYFVQSDERRFNPDNTREQKTIEATYRLDLEYITEALWIQGWLKDEFGHIASYVPNGLNEAFLAEVVPVAKRQNRKRILLEGPISCWFKGMHEAYEAVRNLDADIWIISSSGRPPKTWEYDRFFEKVPINEMNSIYASCDIFLKMSRIEGFFGPPLEAMGCGAAVVVGKVTGYDEYIVHNENALAIESGDINAAREACRKLLQDNDLRERIQKNGRSTAEFWGWDRSIDYLEQYLTRKHSQGMGVSGALFNYKYTDEMTRLKYAHDEWKKKYQ